MVKFNFSLRTKEEQHDFKKGKNWKQMLTGTHLKLPMCNKGPSRRYYINKFHFRNIEELMLKGRR